MKSVCRRWAFCHPGQPLVTEYIGTKILAYLEAHPQYRRIAVLMSRRVSDFTAARAAIQGGVRRRNVHFYCGISSAVYFASKIPTSAGAMQPLSAPWQAGESSVRRAGAVSEGRIAR
ncbi:MAG: hypothetical protein ACLTSZ_17205 [Lachnospiraceae bacterium]